MTSQPRVSVLEEFIESSDRRRLLVRSWRPAHEIRAALAIVPGLHVHSVSYERFANELAVRGIASYASRTHSDAGHLAECCGDVNTVACTIQEREPSRPIFLLGQSTGGVVACLHAIANPRQLDGVICASIALELSLPAISRRAIGLLAALAPRMPLLRVQDPRSSRDPRIGERLSASTLAEMFRANDRLRTSATQLLQPLLLLHGSADKVTLPSGSEYLHDHAGSRDKTLQIFEGYHHDLINEQGHELVVTRICQWIDAQLNAAGRRTQISIEYINAGS